MLRRNSSKNRQRRPLGRSKSTNSIVRNPVHALQIIDPVLAERDAQIAASLSYQRAMERNSVDMLASSRDRSSFAWPRNSHTSNMNGLARSDSATSRHDMTDTACALKRQQSVRFAGPNARPKKPLAARAKRNPGPKTGDGLRLRVIGDARHCSNGGPLQSYISGLQPPGGYYTPEDDVASVPSSYRKLRKSRSLFTPTATNSYPAEYPFQEGSSEVTKRWVTGSRFSSLNKENEPMADEATPSLRAPKSAGLLRHTASRSSSRADNDLAVHLAHDKFREHLEEQSRLKAHPSMFFRTKFKSSVSSTGFRRSLRNTSNNSTGISSAFSGHSLSIPKHSGLRRTARKVSRTLRSKFKGIFGKSKSADDATEVDGQVCDHGSEDDSCLRTGNALITEEASMSRVPSRMPSLHAVPSNQQLRSHQGSMESLVAEEQRTSDDKSRVTSWTNSITNTVTSQTMAGDCEGQRLSVIKENGMHVSSLTLNQPSVHDESVSLATTLAPGATVDSQRVYSALMKRLEETRQKQLQGNKIPDGSMAQRLASRRSSRFTASGTQDGSSPTIRCVQADDDVFQDQRSKFDFDDVLSSTGSAIHVERRSGSGSPSPVYKAYPSAAARDGRGLSTGKSITSRPGFDSPRPASHRSSAFFASPSCHMFRTASPFRRALQENMKVSRDHHEVFPPETSHLNTLSALRLPARRPSVSDSEYDPRVAYAESIYSLTADDAQGRGLQDSTPAMGRSPEPSRGSGHGDATIFVGPPVYQPSPSHRRDFSSASSAEWKTWLSANVSKLEESSVDAHYSLPISRHVREDAEIDPVGETAKPEVYNPWQSETSTPLKAMVANSRSNSAQREPHKAAVQSSAPSNENSAPKAYIDAFRPPPIPRRSALRIVPSLPSIRAEPYNVDSHNSKIPRTRSYNTIALPRSSPMYREDLLKRRSRTRLGEAASSARSSPGLTAAVERQFGKASLESPNPVMRREPLFHTPRPSANAGESSTSGSVLAKSDLDAQVMGSKRMVDLFLSSRRRRIQSSRSGTGSDGSSAAFL